jgi:hypothetical protein
VQLPTGLRVASTLAVGVWVLAALIVLGRAGFQLSPLPAALARWGTWILVGVLPLGALMNLASPSSWERFLWGPVALILAVLCLALARGTTPPRDRASIDQPAHAARSLVGDVRGEPAVRDAVERAGRRPGLLVAGATDGTGGRRPTPAPLEVR